MDEEEMNNLMEQANLQTHVGQQVQGGVQQQYYQEEQERTIAETQLEVNSILREIYHMLRQDTLQPTDKPREEEPFKWVPIEDETQRALTDYGVERIMQVMKSYVNKNTLLSNFNEEQIKKRMLNFALALNGNIFMKYEVYFRNPTLEEVKKLLEKRLKEQKQIKMFAGEIVGVKVDEKKAEAEVMKSIENRVEYELKKIREEVLKRNLKEYELLFEQLKAIVEATHNRAFRGEERGSLRRHMNVSEILGPQKQMPRESGGMFKWIKG